MTRNQATALEIITVSAVIAALFLMPRASFGHDHDDFSVQYNEWAKKQLVMPESGHRFACTKLDITNNSCYCCHQSEIVKTKFRSSQQKDANGKWRDEWWWLVPSTNTWKRVPPDVIHPQDEETPTGEPVLFLLNGVERCFFIGRNDG